VTQDLQQNRYDQLLRRVGGLIGPGAKVNEVLGELFPVLDVESIPGELMFLAGWRLSFGSASVTGSVAQHARMQVFNPVDSGKLLTVTSCVITTSSTQTIRWAVVGIPLTTGIGTELIRDTRKGVINRPSGQIRTDDTPAATDAQGRARISSTIEFTLTDSNGVAVLAPGTGFEVGSGTTNTNVQTTFYWRERPAEQSELQF